MPATRGKGAKRTVPLTSSAKITSKGQITLPIALRRRLGLRPGDRVVFKTKGSDVVLVRQQEEDVFEKYRGMGTPGIGPGKKAVLDWVRDIRGEL